MKDGGDATLVLMGSKLMALPEEPYIRFAGRLSDRERLQALEAATVVVCPSPFESLSLLALEALSVGTPILANARSAVLVEHCVRSNGGLYYADRDEFIEAAETVGRRRSRLRRRPSAQRRRLKRRPESTAGDRVLESRTSLARTALRALTRIGVPADIASSASRDRLWSGDGHMTTVAASSAWRRSLSDSRPANLM